MVDEGRIAFNPAVEISYMTEEHQRWLKEERKAILLVEDNADLRQLIAETLNEKFQITQARDGLEALQLMEKKDFDLVISDIMMPNKDGVSLCNEIKNNLDTSHIPVVLLTAKTSLESKLEASIPVRTCILKNRLT